MFSFLKFQHQADGLKLQEKKSKREQMLVSNLVCDVERRYAYYSDGKSSIYREM
jgi:hypothetical protein